MLDITLIESSYKKYASNLENWLPDGVLNVNLALLNQFDLLHFQPLYAHKASSQNLTFQVIESPGKVTLINDSFIVWVVPHNQPPSETYVLIALQNDDGVHLETAFVTKGIYNTSSIVFGLLEKLLQDIDDTEAYLKKL